MRAADDGEGSGGQGRAGHTRHCKDEAGARRPPGDQHNGKAGTVDRGKKRGQYIVGKRGQGGEMDRHQQPDRGKGKKVSDGEGK